MNSQGKENYILLKKELKEEGCLQQYLNNCRADTLFNPNGKRLQSSPYRSLRESFSWQNSPEGSYFWERIYNELQRKYILPF